jgi:hypothetical protein
LAPLQGGVVDDQDVDGVVAQRLLGGRRVVVRLGLHAHVRRRGLGQEDLPRPGGRAAGEADLVGLRAAGEHRREDDDGDDREDGADRGELEGAGPAPLADLA